MKDRGAIWHNLVIALGLALMVAALYMIFVYVPTEKATGAIQRIFYFHVPLAWVGFLAFFVVFISSIMYLWKHSVKWDALARASAEVGVVFTSLVLITGSIWAKPVWGIWWTWDARLTGTLVLWFIYIAYLMVRGYAREESQGARFGAVLGIVGFLNVPIVALATLSDTEDDKTYVEAGVNASVDKPIQGLELYAALVPLVPAQKDESAEADDGWTPVY